MGNLFVGQHRLSSYFVGLGIGMVRGCKSSHFGPLSHLVGNPGSQAHFYAVGSITSGAVGAPKAIQRRFCNSVLFTYIAFYFFTRSFLNLATPKPLNSAAVHDLTSHMDAASVTSTSSTSSADEASSSGSVILLIASLV